MEGATLHLKRLQVQYMDCVGIITALDAGVADHDTVTVLEAVSHYVPLAISAIRFCEKSMLFKKVRQKRTGPAVTGDLDAAALPIFWLAAAGADV
jgi:hypothetical protein